MMKNFSLFRWYTEDSSTYFNLFFHISMIYAPEENTFLFDPEMQTIGVPRHRNRNMHYTIDSFRKARW